MCINFESYDVPRYSCAGLLFSHMPTCAKTYNFHTSLYNPDERIFGGEKETSLYVIL